MDRNRCARCVCFDSSRLVFPLPSLSRVQVDAEEIREEIFAQQIPYCPVCKERISRSNSATQSPERPSEAEGGSPPVIGPALPPPPQPGIMKPDIVFFGESLGDEFHRSVAKDKEEVDLLIMIGSSLKVSQDKSNYILALFFAT